MYDPITKALIRSGPLLTGLDRDNLPAELTRIYAQLVSERLQVRRDGEGEGPALVQIRRLANTYETYAATLPERPDREASAFVAATSHGLIALAERVRGGGGKLTGVFATHISSDISACLLFLSAGYFADASETARRFAVAEELTGIARVVVLVIGDVAVGRLASARERCKNVEPAGAADADPSALGAARLYMSILNGLAVLVDGLIDGGDSVEAQRVFQTVTERSYFPLAAERDGLPTLVSTFAGPHHLATLLLQAAKTLLERRVTKIQSPPGVDTDQWRSHLSRIAKHRPFLWRSHQEAVASGYLQPGFSAVLSFPTGAGKSTMAELKIASTMAIGRSVLYLAPTHALVNQVVRDLKAAFPLAEIRDSFVQDAAYVEVGDFNPAGKIAVMTPERALTLMSATNDFSELGLVVMDECHLIHPSKRERDRRSLDAMLCLLTATAHSKDADVLLMSAMMANHNEIAGWVAELTARPCLPLSVDWKPTRQVRGCVVFERERIGALQRILQYAKRAKKTKAPSAETRRALLAAPYALFSLDQTWATQTFKDYVHLPLLGTDVPLAANSRWGLSANRNEISAHVATRFAERGMRVLVFAQDPSTAASLAGKVALALPKSPELNAEEVRLLMIAEQEAGGKEHVLGMTNGGAVVHHGLLLPEERRLVESVYKRGGDIPVVLVGTPTLAQGINLPAEVVIVSGDDRFDPKTKRSTPLEAQELLNAVGRAGRAGFSSVGVVLVVPGEVVEFDRQETSLGARWFKLQKDVFSKMDQCLTIDDPLETLLDVVQEGVQQTAEAKYFLNRLPVDADSTRRLLARSFGAYRARRRLAPDAFEEKVERAIRNRGAQAIASNDVLVHLAVSAGIDPVVAAELGAEVADNATLWCVDSISAVVDRVFAWFGQRPARARGFFRSLEPTENSEDVEDELATSAEMIRDLTLRWIEGDTLADLEVAMTGKAPATKGCLKARKFVLRVVPEVAYIVGLFAHAYRLSVGPEGVVPLCLAVGAECVKRGLDSPEKLALSYQSPDDQSRKEYAEVLATLEWEPSSTTDDFASVMATISKALLVSRVL